MNSKALKQLTICIPTRDRSNFLRNCLKRIKETLPDCNIIICDNSQIFTMECVLKEFPKLKIDYLKPQGNLSIYENFDRCISHVKSKYFFILGDDDLIGDRLYFHTALNFLEKNKCSGMVCGRVRMFDIRNVEKISTYKFHKSCAVHPYTRSNLLFKLPFPTITGCIFRTSSFGSLKFCSYNHSSADTSLLLEILLKIECFFINLCPTIMVAHDKNDHVTLDREEIKKDLNCSFSNCLYIAKLYGINQNFPKIIYSFFVINRFFTHRDLRFFIFYMILSLKGFNIFYLIFSILILFKKWLFKNSR